MNRNAASKYSVHDYFYAHNLDIYKDHNEAIMHHKVIVTDDTLLTGSYAIANRANRGSSSRYNDDMVLVIKNKKIADFYVTYLSSLRMPN